MRTIVHIAAAEIRPEPEAVLESLGFSDKAEPDARTRSLLDQALDQLEAHASPIGVFAGVSVHVFEGIYRGEGENEPETPLMKIFPKGDHLAVFAVTLGAGVSVRIATLFDSRDFALATILDAAASEAAEHAADAVQLQYQETLAAREPRNASMKLLRYSPGYCGWHISGQKALFDFLRPQGIGITLRESYLMEPLKSISGLIVAAAADIHRFEDAYPFCADCRSRSCHGRIAGRSHA